MVVLVENYIAPPEEGGRRDMSLLRDDMETSELRKVDSRMISHSGTHVGLPPLTGQYEETRPEAALPSL